MGQSRQDLDVLDERVGYALKRASVALHQAMEEAVAPHELTVAQYACLEVLGRHPGASPAELARGAFVTRQAVHQVLRRLIDDGLVQRAPHPTLGQRQQLALTPAGEQRRRSAAAEVARVEAQIASALPSGGVAPIAQSLRAITRALQVDAASG
jgi:DNA-binding MarR family transcriptional regulator